MKILIIHASAGAGHQKAAEAIANGIKTSTSYDVTLVDALDYTSQAYKYLYRQTYTFLISNFPQVWGIFFGLADVPLLLPLVKFIRRTQNGLNGQPLNRFLQQEQFDYIISTHFFPTEVSAYLKRTGRIRSKIITVVTDFDVHSIWLADGVDKYTAASEWTKNKLHQIGINEDKVFVTGIPTHEKFSIKRDKNETRRKLGLKENVFTVLVATGSFGIGPIEEIIRAIDGIQAAVVCGHNKELFERLGKIERFYLKIFGLVNNMEELMAASDAMVTKPGGLSICEALVSHLPMIFFNAIPGQETGNVSVLKEHGIGISNCSILEIAQQLKAFQSSPAEFQKAVDRTKILAKPNAVQDIIKLII